MISFKGGDGPTKKEAIVILGANNETEGVDSEHSWLEEKYGEENVEWGMVDQELIDENDKQYDLLKIKIKSGVIDKFWFDISYYYEK